MRKIIFSLLFLILYIYMYILFGCHREYIAGNNGSFELAMLEPVERPAIFLPPPTYRDDTAMLQFYIDQAARSPIPTCVVGNFDTYRISHSLIIWGHIIIENLNLAFTDPSINESAIIVEPNYQPKL